MKIKPTIQYPDFEKLDIRVGKILEAISPEWSRKLIEFSVDFGEEIGQKTILSGIKEWYVPEEFIGKSYPFIINLEERKMGEGVSQGMMLMADEAEKPIPFVLPSGVVPGSIIR